MSDIEKDFKKFLQSREPAASEKILDHVHVQIDRESPGVPAVAMQMGLIHLASSFLTLMICPQFGFRLFFSGHGLMGYFMQAGTQACFLLCGAFYLGFTFLLARWTLAPDSWILIKKARGLFAGALALLTVGAFSMWGYQLSFDLGLMWFLGAYVGAWIFSLPHPKRSLISKG